jgi:hypothetical protein
LTRNVKDVQQQMDQGKEALRELAPVVANYYRDTRATGLGRVDSLLLTGVMLVSLSRSRE